MPDDLDMQRLMHALGERVKELTCLHDAAQILQDDRQSVAMLIERFAGILPRAWQYADDAVARVTVGNESYSTSGFAVTPWLQRAEFADATGARGSIEVGYLTEKPIEDEGVFLAEERRLIDSLADMLRFAIDRRRAEEALRDSEVRLRQEIRFIDTLMDSLPAMVLLYDESLRLVKWNRIVEEVTGYGAAELSRSTVADIVSSGNSERGTSAARDVFTAGRHAGDAIVLTKDGRTIPYFFNSVDIEMEVGRCVLGVGVDVTAQRRLEEQVRRSHRMESFGQLAGGVAHDFNNIVTVITGFSDIVLAKLGLDDPLRRHVEEIREAGQRASSLTRQLLAFSRRAVIEPRAIDLNHEVSESATMLRRMIGEDIELTTVLHSPVGLVAADPGQIAQVLMNLAVNARDAMPRGGQLTIETRNVTLDPEYAALHDEVQPGDFVMLAVSDTGCGIAPEIQGRIFEPFFTTKGAGNGTGLGLAVVHGIIKQRGGSIEVYSEPDVGTTIKLYFPVAGESLLRADTPAIDPGRGGNETILLTEDEDGVRGLAMLVLQTHGYNVLTASDAEQALHIVDAHVGRIDLLITDVVMPGRGGRDLAEALIARLPHLKVLYMSGFTDDAVVRHGILHEDVAFLQKPFTGAALVARVREVLDAQ